MLHDWQPVHHSEEPSFVGRSASRLAGLTAHAAKSCACHHCIEAPARLDLYRQPSHNIKHGTPASSMLRLHLSACSASAGRLTRANLRYNCIQATLLSSSAHSALIVCICASCVLCKFGSVLSLLGSAAALATSLPQTLTFLRCRLVQSEAGCLTRNIRSSSRSGESQRLCSSFPHGKRSDLAVPSDRQG